MAIVIQAQNNDSTNDIIRKFKRATITTNIVQIAKDRRYHQKPSKIMAQKKIEKNRLRRKARVLKHTKNVSAESLQKLYERIEGK
jgi:ribosomal protein S21